MDKRVGVEIDFGHFPTPTLYSCILLPLLHSFATLESAFATLQSPLLHSSSTFQIMYITLPLSLFVATLDIPVL